MKFSIITPVYNVKPYLAEMLDSVRCQTHQDWEHIIINDGSTDGSAERLDQYAAKDPRIKVIHQDNCGVGAARNCGLRVASGEWVVFLDADDVLRDDFLQMAQSGFMAFRNADIVKLVKCDFGEAKTLIWPDDYKDDYSIVDVRGALPASLIFAGIWECVVKRESLSGVEFSPYCIGEDRLFLSEVLAKASYVAVIDHVSYGYRRRMGSAMNSAITRLKLEHRIGYSLAWIGVLACCGKRIPSSFFRLVVNDLTENFVFDIYIVSPDARSVLWDEWYRMLEVLCGYKQFFSAWSRFVIGVCVNMRFHWIANVLCRFPRILKNSGINREVFMRRKRKAVVHRV